MWPVWLSFKEQKQTEKPWAMRAQNLGHFLRAAGLSSRFLSACVLHRGGKGPNLPALFLIVIHWSQEAEMGISVYLISGFLQEG